MTTVVREYDYGKRKYKNKGFSNIDKQKELKEWLVAHEVGGGQLMPYYIQYKQESQHPMSYVSFWRHVNHI
jgi:hypothetical protein